MMGNPGLDQIQSLLVGAPIHLANQLEIISGFNPYPNIPNIFKNLSHLWQIFGRHFSDAVKRYNYIHMHMLCTYVYIYNTKQKKTPAITSQSCALQPALHILPLWMPEGHRCWPKSQRCSQRHSLWQSNDQHI